MAGYSQSEHLLRIDTVLNNHALFPQEAKFTGDPLLLTKLDGVEGISQLFAYDVIMLRDAGGREGEEANGQKRPPVDTTKLIGTHAEIGARPSNSTNQTDDEIFFKRVGMFETFEDLLAIDITKIKTFIPFVPDINERDFHIYRARVVPWVKALSRDICYRVFEGKTVVQIIDAIADEAKATFSHLKIDTTALKGAANPPPHPFTPIDYCVQFGESTLSFLSRLMARFGIWYYFGSNADSGNFVLNDVMILKGSWDNKVTTVGLDNIKIKNGDGPEIREVGKLVRRFRPPERRTAVGGFNYLDPTHPFYKDEAVSPSDDLLKNEGGPASQTKFSGTTSFAQPVFADPDAAVLEDSATAQNQAEVFLISGVSKNQSFIPGESFRIEKSKDFDPNDNLNQPYIDVVDRNFVIDTLALTANDYDYVNVKAGGLQNVLDFFTHTIAALEADALDNTNNAFYKASLWATKTAEAKIYTAINPLSGTFPDTASGLASDVAGAMSALSGVAGGALGPVGSVLGAADFKRAVTDITNMTVFAVGIIAVPADAPIDPPLPLATRPVARGPHTAVVIGPDDGKGVDTSEHDIFCDAIGRVRVRFPWDPGPPQGSSKIPPVFPFKESDKPTKIGGNTCWVRVVEGWAGRQYGTQFLPRIGQEVLIDFLDGDPERPVIVGRLYNADKGKTNLPFPDSQLKDTEIKNLSGLPATSKFDLPLSGIKTWSIPTTGKDDSGNPTLLPPRFHLLRFSDKRNHEQYLIRSQHRLDITALEKRYESISSDRHLSVGGKKLTPPPKEIGGDYLAHVFRHYHLHVGDPDFPAESGNRITLIEQNDRTKVVKTSDQDVGGDWSTSAGGQATIAAMGPGGTIVLSATTNITLSVGATSIVVTPAGVSITAPVINLVSPATLSTLPVIRGAAPLPPAPPILPAVPKPTDPTPADPGDTLTPPE
jgi:uncharacterized protein involved in type VI secretion and phage assembly